MQILSIFSLLEVEVFLKLSNSRDRNSTMNSDNRCEPFCVSKALEGITDLWSTEDITPCLTVFVSLC